MTLNDVLKRFNYRDFETIEYRAIISIDSNDVDILFGFAAFKDGELISVDNDTYSLSDEVVEFGLRKPGWLTVWVDSE